MIAKWGFCDHADEVQSAMETVAAIPSVTVRAPPNSGLAARVGLRGAAIYLLLHNLGAVIALVPGLGPLADRVGTLFKHGAAWVGKEVLRISRDIPVGPTGSSDTTADWLRVGCFAAAALVAAVVWSRIDRRQATDESVRRWLRLLLRFTLGNAMLVYGVMKLIPPTQFPFPSYSQLTQTLGEFSPQGLLWKFMGFSPVYVAFLGIGEVMAGALLFFRRTTLAGALLAAAILANVVMLNFCYDVPVKLYAGHLLLMALWILWPDRGRLAAILLNRRVEAAADELPSSLLKRPRFAVAFQCLVILDAVFSAVGGQLRASASNANLYGFTPAELRGIWRVDAFERNDRPVPPLATDATRWHSIIFGDFRAMLVRGMNGQRIGFWFVRKLPDSGGYVLEPPGAAASAIPVAISLLDGGQMRFEAALDGQQLRINLHRVDEQQFVLLSRGFHWITETSFNR
jgi:hypothetical protein